MAIELREEIGYIPIYKNRKKSVFDIKESSEDINPISDNSIMQEIEGLHVGPTRNFTWYMDQALLSSIPSWTKPYQKPLIMHHNEENGKIIGRVCSVNHITEGTRSGTPALRFICNVPDPDGIQQIEDGRLKTVSVGVTATDVRCSICGKQIEELDEDGIPKCGHEKGVVYKGKTCYWEIYEMEAKELSYVIVPSDIYTHNIRTFKPDKNKKISLSESYKGKEIKKMNGEKGTDVKEKENINEEVKDKNAATEKDIADETQKSILAEKDAEIDELKIQLEEKDKELKAATEKIDSVKKDLQVALDRIDSLQSDLKQEITLKEAAEDANIKSKTQIREMLEDQVVSYRNALGKPLVLKESLKERSFDSLKDSLKDLESEFANFKAVKEIPKATDPTLKESDDPAQKNKGISVKESAVGSNNTVNAREESDRIKKSLFN